MGKDRDTDTAEKEDTRTVLQENYAGKEFVEFVEVEGQELVVEHSIVIVKEKNY